MGIVVRLVPIGHHPNEILRTGVPHRRVITLDDDDRMITIGRGPQTGINDPTIVHQAFQLQLDQTSTIKQQVLATLMADKLNNTVYINGLPWEDDQRNVYLGHGDTISLSLDKYQYQVEITTTNTTTLSKEELSEKKRKLGLLVQTSPKQEPESDSTASLVGLANGGIAIPQEAASGLAEEIQCSVCLEIQVNPRTLYPCGHSFCGSCLVKLQQCPQCRATVESHVPAVQLDSLILTLVTIPNLLNVDDVKHYHERKSTTTTTTASHKKTRKTTPNRRRGYGPTSSIHAIVGNVTLISTSQTRSNVGSGTNPQIQQRNNSNQPGLSASDAIIID